MTINATIVLGPTGVGKSKWAMDYAKQHGGTIINADSQQCYQACPILTARPSPEDEAECPHLGYGTLPANAQTTVGWWLKVTAEYLAPTPNPIIVGGTGMYVDALLNGLSYIPIIHDDVLAKVEEFAQTPRWMEKIKEWDPTLPATMVDPQRLKRALGVLWQTNHSITTFWQQKTYAAPTLKARVVVMDMPMTTLAPRLEARLLHMIQNGAMEEVQSFQHQPPSHYQGIACALGFRHIMDYLNGQTTLDNMIHAINHDTRLYAKRQRTWFRNRITLGTLVEEVTHINV